MSLADHVTRWAARTHRDSHPGPLGRAGQSAVSDLEPGADPHPWEGPNGWDLVGPTASREAPGARGKPSVTRGVEAVLVAAWDLVVVLGALVLTGALGGALSGWIARGLVALFAVLAISAVDAYRRTSWLRQHPLQIVGRLIVASTFVAWAAVIAAAVVGAPDRPGPLILTWLLAAAGWYAGRQTARLLRRRARPERMLIVGRGVVADRVLQLSRRPGSAAVVIGCLDDNAERGTPGGPPLLGPIDQLPRVLASGEVDRVIVAFSASRDYRTLDVLRSCSGYRGPVDIVPRFFDLLGPRALMYDADGLSFLSIPGRRWTRGRAMLKRTIDFVGASALLIVLSPLLLGIAAAIMIDSGGPVLFRQRRIGMRGRTFSILKFRTLRPDSGTRREIEAIELTPGSIGVHVEQAKQEAAKRATRVGAFLRKTSLDELPQLFNVLVGQMSLVGPRPLSPLEDAVLDGWELMRREMRPGITGLWQVSGRSEVSWEHRINLDYRQVRNWSLFADLRVMADTVRAVLRRRGAE
jgi:exopolysaccharide biosynthesis polyprenyl glycosylphosphotransferase